MPSTLKSYIEIFGKDSTDKLFNGISSKLDKLGGKVGSVTSSVGVGVFGAELATRGLDAAIGAVTSSIGAMGTALGNASQAEDTLLSQTASFAALADVGFDKAEESITRVTDRLAVSAATLPGVTEEYAKLGGSIIDNVIPAATGLNGALDYNKLEDDVASLSESFGALGANAGVATADISKGLSKALSGKSLSELGDLQFYEENPAVLAMIEKKLADRNVETLKDLDVSARVGLIREVGESFINDEFKAAAADNVSGLVEGFKTALLDPKRGVFGVARDIFPDLEGNQSVFSEFKNILKGVIGPGGLFAPDGQLAGVLEVLGVDLPDPMAFLYRQLQKVTKFVDDVDGFLFNIKNTVPEPGSVGAIIEDLFNGGAFDFSAYGAKVGEVIGGAVDRTADFLLSAVDNNDEVAMGSQIGDYLSTSLLSLVENIPWLKVGELLIKLPIALGDLVANAVMGGLEGVADEIAESIRSQASELWRASTDFFVEPAQQAGKAVTNFFTGGDRTEAAPVKSRKKPKNRAMGWEPSTASPIMQAMRNEMKAAPTNAGLLVANSTERVIPRGQPGNDGKPLYTGQQGGDRTSQNVSVSFSPTLVLSAGSTRQQAQEILGQLRSLMAEEMQAQLT